MMTEKLSIKVIAATFSDTFHKHKLNKQAVINWLWLKTKLLKHTNKYFAINPYIINTYNSSRFLSHTHLRALIFSRHFASSQK